MGSTGHRKRLLPLIFPTQRTHPPRVRAEPATGAAMRMTRSATAPPETRGDFRIAGLIAGTRSVSAAHVPRPLCRPGSVQNGSLAAYAITFSAADDGRRGWLTPRPEAPHS
jgi:hypothetical protein